MYVRALAAAIIISEPAFSSAKQACVEKISRGFRPSAVRNGRLSYLDIKEYMYGTQSVEDQKTLLLKDIAKVKFDGGKVGKSFEDCCGDLRTLHQSLDDISRPQSAERKVLDLLEIFRRPDAILTQGMQSVRTDFNGKRLNFEAAVKFLKEFLPKTTQYFINSGVPEHLHSDGAKEMTEKKEWQKVLRDEGGIKATIVGDEGHGFHTLQGRR